MYESQQTRSQQTDITRTNCNVKGLSTRGKNRENQNLIDHCVVVFVKKIWSVRTLEFGM